MPKNRKILKKRADSILVERGFAPDVRQARSLLMAGEIKVDNRLISQPGFLLNPDAVIEKAENSPYVSRGGTKLAFAITCFGIDILGKVAADIGSSTGGFTDCLLQHGACLVYAVDVGKRQLDWKLRRDERVIVMEGVNARYKLQLPQQVDIAVVDVSFISVTKVIPSVADILKDRGQIVILIKPQFEALRQEVGRGGVISDPEIHARVLGRFLHWAVNRSFRLGGLVASPITGASGNREFLVLLSK